MNSKSFLGIDFGAGSIKAAEFLETESGGLYLTAFGSTPLGLAGAQDAAREGAVRRAFQSLLSTEYDFTSRDVNVAGPGYQVFSKFVKLPQVDASKVTQIIRYEAQQNVPFPLEEVVWDYQILDAGDSGEMEVLLVAIKKDLVGRIFTTCETSGLTLGLIDTAPAALCNAFRYNYGDLEGCTLLLDIGAKTSNLLFFEGGRFYFRGINIGANAITQEFANEVKMRFDDAERFKIREGFVSLGGAYEDPDNPRQAQISKIARQVLTRLHIQVNQTIQFYRSQQGGGSPHRLFLAGGASIMPYTSEFLAEKLKLDIEYFNPFRSIEIDEGIDKEALARVAHAFGPAVGLGLRRVVQCPTELNLMPRESIRRQEFNQKKPYFLATAYLLVLIVAAFGWVISQVAEVKKEGVVEIQRTISPLENANRRLAPELETLRDLREEYRELEGYFEERTYWSRILEHVREAMMEVEEYAGRSRVEFWIQSLKPDIEDIDSRLDAVQEAAWEPDYEEPVGDMWTTMGPELRERYGFFEDPQSVMEYGMGGYGPHDPYGTGPEDSMDEEEGLLSTLILECRLANYGNPALTSSLPSRLLGNLRQRSEIFDPDRTEFPEGTNIQKVEGTDGRIHSFAIDLHLAKPIDLGTQAP